jgi:hypothetical protein
MTRAILSPTAEYPSQRGRSVRQHPYNRIVPSVQSDAEVGSKKQQIKGLSKQIPGKAARERRRHRTVCGLFQEELARALAWTPPGAERGAWPGKWNPRRPTCHVLDPEALGKETLEGHQRIDVERNLGNGPGLPGGLDAARQTGLSVFILQVQPHHLRY